MTTPDRPGGDDPFGDLPPELRAMLEQLGGAEGLDALQERFSDMLGGASAGGIGFGGLFGGPAPTGPVDWNLASRVALQIAGDGDRGPTPEELRTAQQALNLAEHWLDTTSLPAPPDAGQVVIASRRDWVTAAITALAPLVEPVARASTDAMIDLAREQLEDLDEIDLQEGMSQLPGLEGMELPPGFDQIMAQLASGDIGSMLRPAGAMMSGLQAGQVIGQLSRQLLGQYDLGIPTAPRSQAHHLAVNIAEAFDGYGLDATEVALVLAVTEAAHRRLYHAVPWLDAHVQSLVARFASGTTVDPDRLMEMQEELTRHVDPEDPDSLREAMERAAKMRLEPTEEQQRILARLQAVVCLVGAWARREVDRAIDDRVPSVSRIEEVLRRRRVSRGDGETLLADLLGLDLKPDDETVGERFVAEVEAALGPAGLRRALDHPENLPDADELLDPASWLARISDVDDVPDDLASLFESAGDAPVEASAAERVAARNRGEEPRGAEEPPNLDDGEADDDSSDDEADDEADDDAG